VACEEVYSFSCAKNNHLRTGADKGAGFDMIVSTEEAGRGLLASLNRGKDAQASTLITLSLPR